MGGSEPSSTSLYVNVGLEVVLQQEGRGTRQGIRDFKKRNRNKSVYGVKKGRHDGVVRHTIRRRRSYSREWNEKETRNKEERYFYRRVKRGFVVFVGRI